MIYHGKNQIKVSKQLEDTDGHQCSKQETWPGFTGAKLQGNKRDFLKFFFLSSPFLHIKKQN